MMSGKMLLSLLCFIGLIQCIASTNNVICYHGTWSHYRTGNGQFSVTDVPANLCTHYIYAFVGLDSTTNEVISLDSWLDFGIGAIGQAINLKQTNPNLKVLLAVGGWNEGSAKYSAMASDSAKRATFIASSLSWVESNGFDGFDLDWEYPARRDSTNTADKENLALLLKEMSEAYHSRGLLLTAAVSATPSSVDISYDVPALSQYLDFINVMLYDFHGSWDAAAYHNAPLYSTTKLAGTEYADYSVNASIMGWIERGASPSKLAMGVPFYGRTAILASTTSTAPGSLLQGVDAAAGPYTATPGFLGYNEIVEKFNAGGWTTAWDDEQQVPYAYSDSTWLSYDNERSLTLKVEFANNLGLGAVMLWSIETEDFLGLSGTKYPLLNAIQSALGSSTSSEESASASSTTTTTTTTASTTTVSTTTLSSQSTASTSTTSATAAATSSGSSTTSSANGDSSRSDSSRIADKDSCQSVGYFGCTTDCSIFFYCQEENGVLTGVSFSCTSGLLYDTEYGVCNYASLVNNC